MIIEEVEDPEKKVITEIASDNWETYSMDYTTSATCKQIRVSFTVGRGGWEMISALFVWTMPNLLEYHALIHLNLVSWITLQI